jgi:hypothetical protein
LQNDQTIPQQNYIYICPFNLHTFFWIEFGCTNFLTCKIRHLCLHFPLVTQIVVWSVIAVFDRLGSMPRFTYIHKWKRCNLSREIGSVFILSWMGVDKWGRKQIQFPKRRAFYFVECRTIDKVQKPSIWEYYYYFDRSRDSD